MQQLLAVVMLSKELCRRRGFNTEFDGAVPVRCNRTSGHRAPVKRFECTRCFTCTHSYNSIHCLCDSAISVSVWAGSNMGCCHASVLSCIAFMTGDKEGQLITGMSES